LDSRLKIGADALDRRRAWVATVAQIEHEAGITDHVASKAGRSCIITA
jgi:hypothetical protein